MKNAAEILLKARRQIVGDRIGNNASMFRGEGYDFLELREYIVGDDTRHIDWNITAKMQRPYVKVFREERELNIVSVAMLGGALDFGKEVRKIECVAQVVALIGYSAIANGDVYSHYNFSQHLRDEVRAGKKKFAVSESVHMVMNAPLLNYKADYTAMAQSLYKRLKRRSLIVVIGDFFEIPDMRLLAKKHEVVAVIVRDRLEEKPEPFGFTAMIDPESGVVLEGDFNTPSVQKYHEKVCMHDGKLFEQLRRDGIRYTKLYTDSNTVVTLRRLFEGRL
jgi:uncharacterized protein (DUF58 family)